MREELLAISANDYHCRPGDTGRLVFAGFIDNVAKVRCRFCVERHVNMYGLGILLDQITLIAVPVLWLRDTCIYLTLSSPYPPRGYLDPHVAEPHCGAAAGPLESGEVGKP